MSMNIAKSASQMFNKAAFQLRKHSPEIMVIGGVIGGVVSAVMACKATSKASEILAESKEEIDQINMAANDPDIPAEKYSQEDHVKDLTGAYVRTGLKLAKVYAPSVILGGLSITSILGGHGILQKRNVALAAAYATIDQSFTDYRDRVIDKFGESVDYQLKHSLKAEEVTEKEKDPETGKTKKVKKEILVKDENIKADGYSRLFAAGCNNWNNDANLNRSFLSGQQNFANDKLRAQGYLFLSDVYKVLGFRETPESRVVGWIYDYDNEEGDNYVDFGFDKDPDFMSGREKNVWLDFNVDGPILDRFVKADTTQTVC